MSFSGFIVQLINGLASASSLFLVAAGLSLIFGVTRIVNFAHGSFFMVGIYVAYSLVERLSGALGFWVALPLAPWNRRVLVGAPDYLERNGRPQKPADLSQHRCLVVRENGGLTDKHFDHWRLHPADGNGALHVQVRGPLSSNSGEMVRDWCLQGQGIMLRSLWDIAPQLESGALVRVLRDHAMPDADIHWLAPYRAQVPRRIRLLVDFLADRFKDEPWRRLSAPAAPPGSRRKR